MRSIFKSFLILTFFMFMPNVSSAQENSFFDLMNIAENIMQNQDNKKIETYDEIFKNACQKYQQGNINVARNEFLSIIPDVKYDLSVLNFSKSLFEMGFFDLGEQALNNIKHKEELAFIISDLKTSYLPSYKLNEEEETELIENFVDIKYGNNADEVSFALSKNKELLKKSDRADYVMAQAQIEMKQYLQALDFINRALKKNPQNALYIYQKAKLLTLAQDWNNAIKTIKKAKKEHNITLNFKNDFLILEEYTLMNLAKKEQDKRYHSAMIYYLKGDYYKSKKECESVLGKDKGAYKILSLYGQNSLKINDLKTAEESFKKAYKINKKYAPALEGLGDIEFIDFQYKSALEYYKSALKFDKNNARIAYKIVFAKSKSNKSEDLEKYKQNAKKLENKPFMEFFEIATSIGVENYEFKKDCLIKSVIVYPLYQNSWLELVQTQIKDKKLKLAKNMLLTISLDKNCNYRYYYDSALVNLEEGDKKKALENLKNALNLNVDFEPAKELQAVISADIGEKI